MITTVAGTGKVGFVSDADLRTESPDLCGASMSPAFDETGAIHVVCPLANRVVRVEPDGSFLTVAGSGEAGYSGDGGPAVEAAPHHPTGINAGRAPAVEGAFEAVPRTLARARLARGT